ncbi:SRPBCC domain-containing protein [Nocardioides sp. GY 10113]|uniref:SRPBCC domain-containing protein n=1 Tax=Nocardioides sp. GY 10113 TaxID=2569761 RepID=UPI0010A7F6E9|nr:SRPBCC domain-containing protein [Nocardioides sp. GY 10113]TIC87329.1 SRPBCC domain-containing protein [Nocardioides sp. GY 10113]
MQPHSFTTTYLVDRAPGEVISAICDVRAWWSGDIVGPTRAPGDVFEYRFEDIHHSRIRVEAVSDTRVVWLVLDTHLAFVEDQSEWVGTQIVFDVDDAGEATRFTFTHDGLVPDFECYDACQQGWTMYAGGSLQRLLRTGRGDPAGDGNARTAAEAAQLAN